jgi:hypothetical protein
MRAWGAAGRRPAAAALGAVSLLLAIGCREGDRAATAPLPPADATYTTRGVVQQLPTPPANELMVLHETVPEFVDRKGETTGMESMTMPFSVAADVPLTGLAEGDKVEMTFEVRWQGPTILLVTALRELPADAEVAVGGAARGTEAAPGTTVTPAPDAADGGVTQGSSEAI